MRLAIVEDDVMLRETLQLLFRGEKEIVLAGSYSSGEDALQSIQGAAPEVVLCDLGLPGMSGVELIKKMKALNPSLEIMAHTVFDDREIVFSALKAGATGYLLKGSSPREIIEALSDLHRGGSPMSPKIARKVIQEFRDEELGGPSILSQREKELLRRIEQGMTYKKIASELGISANTVHSHIKRIYERLQARDRAEALARARKTGAI